MKTLIVTQEKPVDEFVKEAKELLAHESEIILKAHGRDTVRAVDVAELLKKEGHTAHKVEISTDEKEVDEEVGGKKFVKKIRTSTMTIEIHK